MKGSMNTSVSPKPSARSLAHNLPSVLKSHTQQGFDELHSSENQDRHCFHYDEQRHLLWMGVFDGHSGSCAAEYLSLHVLDNINRFLGVMGPFDVDHIEEAMRDGILLTEEQFKKEDAHDGACVLLVCLSGINMIVANLGDSRAVLGKSSPASAIVIEARQLTNDHNASNPREAMLARFRFLRNMGALSADSHIEDFTEQELIDRVKVELEGEDLIHKGRIITTELTRSFGDFPTKKHCFNVISNEPELTVVRLDRRCQILILASDGIWARLTNEAAAQMAYDKIRNLSSFYMGVNSPAQQIVEEAVLQGSGDDQTCLILNLKKYYDYLYTMKHKSWDDLHRDDGASPLLSSISHGVFIAHRACNLQSILTSSATRPFPVKLAELNRRGDFISSSEPTVFDNKAKVAQTNANDAHRFSKAEQGRGGTPLASPNLSLFEREAKNWSERRKSQQKKEKEEVEKGLQEFCKELTRFEEDAKNSQAAASEVHRHSKSKLGRSGVPVRSPLLPLHEHIAVENRKVINRGDTRPVFRGTN